MLTSWPHYSSQSTGQCGVETGNNRFSQQWHARTLFGVERGRKNAAHRLPPLCEVCFFTQLPRSRLCVQRRVKQCVVWRWDRPGVCVIHHIRTTKSHSHLGADCEAVVRPHWHYMTTCLKCLNTPACTCGPSHSRSFEVYEPQCFFFFFFFFFWPRAHCMKPNSLHRGQVHWPETWVNQRGSWAEQRGSRVKMMREPYPVLETLEWRF